MQMAFNEAGEYVPTPPHECTDCGICLSVCPFASVPAGRGESPLGQPIASYVGHMVEEERWRAAASGGLTTGLLAAALREEMVDAVVAVVPTGDPAALFKAAVLESPEQVFASAKSKYYPVEFSQVLRQIEASERRYAIVALPCVVRALRLAQESFGWLRERLRFILSLTCGQSKSKLYTSFLLHLAGTAPEKVGSVDYRAAPATTANDFVFQAVDRDGRAGRPLPFWSGPVGAVWTGFFFSLGACFYCEDLFGEYADISIMDAWLPDYIQDTRGHSIVCVRNRELHELLRRMQERAEVALEPIAEETVLASQQVALRIKSERLGPRLAKLERRGVTVPTARVRPEARRVSVHDWQLRCHQKLSRLLVRGSGLRFLIGCWALRVAVSCGWGLLTRARRILGVMLRRLRRSER